MPKVGDVFRIEKDFTSTGQDAKSRWFIYLGKVSCFETPQNIFLCTTTTQIQRYENIPPNQTIHFSAKDGVFTKDCIAYLKGDIKTEFTWEKFKSYIPIEKGSLSKDKLHELISKLKTVGLSKKILQDILQSCRLDGIPTN